MVPVIIFDINGEYIGLPDAAVLRWGDNYFANLAEVGYEMLLMLVRSLSPLPETSDAIFENQLTNRFNAREAHCTRNDLPFTIDIAHLQESTWSNNEHIEGAIQRRLRLINDRSLFSTQERANDPSNNFNILYENACNGNPIVFDMKDLSTNLQHALVKAMNSLIERVCGREYGNSTGRFPFVFFEEAHFYIREDTIINLITRGRHIGIASIFVTNSPQKLPDTVFRQLDNLFLLSLTHKEDIRNVSKNSFTDEMTIENFATRMPVHHALIMGNVTERYPLILSVDPLPSVVPPSGVTRSTWTRFDRENNSATETPQSEGSSSGN